MKSVGEAMAFGRTFQESFQKVRPGRMRGVGRSLGARRAVERDMRPVHLTLRCADGRRVRVQPHCTMS